MNIKIGDKTLKATLTIQMQDYASMEKVGSLGFNLPRNDQRITAKPGDIILYQGSLLVLYYAPNTWNFTRLGTIDDLNIEELKSILKPNTIEVVLSK
jgi:hypothetical protein